MTAATHCSLNASLKQSRATSNPHSTHTSPARVTIVCVQGEALPPRFLVLMPIRLPPLEYRNKQFSRKAG